MPPRENVWFTTPQSIEAKVGNKFSFEIKGTPVGAPQGKFKDLPLKPEEDQVKGKRSAFQSLLANPAVLLLLNNALLAILALVGYWFWKRRKSKS